MILFNSKYKGRSVKLRCPHCYGEIQAYSKGTEKLIDDPPFLSWFRKHFPIIQSNARIASRNS